MSHNVNRACSHKFGKGYPKLFTANRGGDGFTNPQPHGFVRHLAPQERILFTWGGGLVQTYTP